jgi:hypothetical protein
MPHHVECKYHVVWIPKCRKKVLFGKLRRCLGGVRVVIAGRALEIARRVATAREGSHEEEAWAEAQAMTEINMTSRMALCPESTEMPWTKWLRCSN